MADRLRRIFRSVAGQLFGLASIFTLLISIAITISPAVQARTWSVNFQWTHWISALVWLIVFGALLYYLDLYGIRSDPILIPVTAMLSAWGLLTIFSISSRLGTRQTIWLIIGISLFVLGLPHMQRVLAITRKYKYIWLVGGITITALTLIFGTNPIGSGPRLWFGCCGIYFQPSEPLKILLVLYLAAYFTDRQSISPSLLTLLLPTALMTGLACLILVVQRDLGTASILIVIYAAMIYAATGKKRLLMISLLGIGIAALLGYQYFDVVRLRFEAWINPWLDPFGHSYQIVQSLISIAAGGMTGRGPGFGYPELVPISFSDFIFSAIGEEYGLPGTLGLIIALLLFTYRGMKIALTAPNRHLRYISAGISVYIAAQSILIIGGNIRLLPLTGVTLPFLSYGGSSLLTSLFALYLLIAINDATPVKYKTPDPTPILNISLLLTVGFVALALINSWWALWRGPDLLTRADNARRTISDTFIQRGAILDRDFIPLSFSTGSAGSLIRKYASEETAHPIGYTHPYYGQAEAERSLDNILRGLENQSPWTIWINHLIYGQPPPGMDAQISLDSQIQTLAMSVLDDQIGAIILMDATTGEILVMASSPTYNPAVLTDSWDQLINDLDSPLLNRATQGLYPPGPALAPFLITAAGKYGNLPDELEIQPVKINDSDLNCVAMPEAPVTWEMASQLGCPSPLSYLGIELGEENLIDLFTKLGFYQAPDIRLDTSPPYNPGGIPTPGKTAYGQADILVTPLQLALASNALTNQGLYTQPVFLLGYKSPEGSWIELQENPQTTRIFPRSVVEKTTRLLAHPTLQIWETTSYAVTGSGAPVTWYLAGTLPSASTIDKNFTVVVLLEDSNAPLAAKIGHQLMVNVLTP